MFGNLNHRAHCDRACHHVVKVIHLKPQQQAVAIGPLFALANGAVVVLGVEGVQLQNNLAVAVHQLLVHLAAVVAAASQQLLIPTAAGLYVSDCDKRLRAHGETVSR